MGRLAPYFERPWLRPRRRRPWRRACRGRCGSGRPGRSFTRPPRISTIRVLLQVVALAGDVGRDLDPVGQAHARDLAQRRVRLLRRRGVDAHAHAALLRALLRPATSSGFFFAFATLADQLVDRRHGKSEILHGSGRTDPHAAPKRIRPARPRRHRADGEPASIHPPRWTAPQKSRRSVLVPIRVAPRATEETRDPGGAGHFSSCPAPRGRARAEGRPAGF